MNYLDSAFRNIRNLGIVSVTSTDISSLYAKAQHVARRHYGCNIVRTEYYKELAARIVVAAVARYPTVSCTPCMSGYMIKRNNITKSACFIFQNIHEVQILHSISATLPYFGNLMLSLLEFDLKPCA